MCHICDIVHFSPGWYQLHFVRLLLWWRWWPRWKSGKLVESSSDVFFSLLISDSIKESQSDGPALICPKTWDRFTICPLQNSDCIKSWGERTPDGAQMFCFNCISPSGGLLFDNSQSSTPAYLQLFLLRITLKKIKTLLKWFPFRIQLTTVKAFWGYLYDKMKMIGIR